MKTEKKSYIRDGRAPVPEKEITSRIMSAIRARNTRPELILRKALWHNNIRGYRLHWRKAPGTPDISFPGKKIAIFVNGCFWHRCPYCHPSLPKAHTRFWTEKFDNNRTRDTQKLRLLRQQCWDALVLWECQINNDLSGCVDSVNNLLVKKSIG